MFVSRMATLNRAEEFPSQSPHTPIHSDATPTICQGEIIIAWPGSPLGGQNTVSTAHREQTRLGASFSCETPEESSAKWPGQAHRTSSPNLVALSPYSPERGTLLVYCNNGAGSPIPVQRGKCILTESAERSLVRQVQTKVCPCCWSAKLTLVGQPTICRIVIAGTILVVHFKDLTWSRTAAEKRTWGFKTAARLVNVEASRPSVLIADLAPGYP